MFVRYVRNVIKVFVYRKTNVDEMKSVRISKEAGPAYDMDLLSDGTLLWPKICEKRCSGLRCMHCAFAPLRGTGRSVLADH